jgi:hypothetical protein
MLNHAAVQYSIPKSKPAGKEAAATVASVLAQLPAGELAELSGPFWLSAESFRGQGATARAADAEGHIMVADDGRVLAWSGH